MTTRPTPGTRVTIQNTHDREHGTVIRGTNPVTSAIVRVLWDGSPDDCWEAVDWRDLMAAETDRQRHRRCLAEVREYTTQLIEIDDPGLTELAAAALWDLILERRMASNSGQWPVISGQ
jgi:hypothetical protein